MRLRGGGSPVIPKIGLEEIGNKKELGTFPQNGPEIGGTQPLEIGLE